MTRTGGPPTDNLEPGCTWERLDDSTLEGRARIDEMIARGIEAVIDQFREYVADDPTFFAGADINRYEHQIAAHVRAHYRAQIADIRLGIVH